MKLSPVVMAHETRTSVEQILLHARTIGDAVDAVKDLFNIQMDLAESDNTAPNEGVHGDASARDAFLTLLPEPDKRALFLTLVRNSRFWPRIRTLVGSPPFSFLKQQDDAVLRPAGITQGRSHMATADGQISSYASFGSAQFFDAAERDFKVIEKNTTYRSLAPALSISARRGQNLPFIGLNSGDGVIIEVRLKKRSLRNKIEIAQGKSGVARDAIAFPRAGTVVNLQPAKRLRRVVSAIAVHVSAVQMRSVNSNVARMICKIG